LRRWSEQCAGEGSKYVHWIGLYLSIRLSWVLGLFVQGRLQDLKESEDTFGHDIIRLKKMAPAVGLWSSRNPTTSTILEQAPGLKASLNRMARPN